MERIIVSTGIPSFIKLKDEHVVHSLTAAQLPAIRYFPTIVSFVFAVIANAVYVGSLWPSLNNARGFALISISCFLLLTASTTLLGRRERIRAVALDDARVRFLPSWTYLIIFWGLSAALCSIVQISR